MGDVLSLAPTILGLVIYVSLTALDLMGNPEIVASPGFWLRIAIVVGLIKTLAALTKANSQAEWDRGSFE